VFEALAEVGLHFASRSRQSRSGASAWKTALGYAVFGTIVGAVSLLVFPHSIMSTRNGRIVTLVLAPVASGLAMSIIGAWRQRRGQQVLGLDRFVFGYVFAVAMAAVRFVRAK
jgi:hypothetical protein